MPLPKPILDNRNFDQLVEEGRSLLPRLATLWTDHNWSDPGITLLDLFAWFTEMGLYRLDRATDEQLRGFLRLVGAGPRAARVARTVVLLYSATERTLPAGLQIAQTDDSSEVFQSQSGLTVSAAQLVQLIAGDGVDVTAPHANGGGFAPLGETPALNNALYLGFDAPLAAAGSELSAWVWTTTPLEDLETRAALIAEYEHALRVRAAVCPATFNGAPDWRVHYDARLRWEYFAGGDQWKPLDVILDETRALTLSGPIRWRAPADHVAGGPNPALYWIRARLIAGGYECPPRLARIGFNAVEAAHAADVEPVALAASLGHARSSYDLKRAPIVPGSTQLTVQIGTNLDEAWSERADWDLSGPHDRHYVLDAARGRIAFGDGWRGRVVATGATQSIDFQVGGGPSGNVSARTLEHWLNNAHNQALVAGWPAILATIGLEHPYAAAGGAEAETLKAATARTIAELSAPTRAVTLNDFEALALSTPGAPVARVRAIAERHPAFACYPAAGCISLVVVSKCSGARPTPTPGMLAEVQRYLDRRRTPAAELHVIAPTYVTVRVVATVQAKPNAAPEALRALIVSALAQFFHPLHGGPNGEGWPIGRDVYRSEVLALLATLPGVACVLSLGLQGEQDCEPRCANLPVCDDALIAPGEHEIIVRGAPPIRIVDRSIPHECP